MNMPTPKKGDKAMDNSMEEIEVLAEGTEETETVSGCCTGGASSARS